MKRKIILIGGDLASGKSTYSRYISEKYNISLINKDILKEILGDYILTSNRKENKKLSVISFELIKYFIETTKDNIIIESNFKSYEMDELKKYLGDNDILSLHFIGDDKILHQRFLNRLEENRHIVHKSQDFTDISDFIATLTELRNVEYIGKVIKVNATLYEYAINDKQLEEEIINFLNN